MANVLEQSSQLSDYLTSELLLSIGFSNPTTNYLSSYSNETISIYDYLGHVYEVLKLREQLKNVSGDEALIKLFVTDGLVYSIQNDYNLTNAQIFNKYSVKTFENITNQWIQNYKKYTENLEKNEISNQVLSLENIKQVFFNVQQNKSDKNHLEKQFQLFLKNDKSGKYDSLQLDVNGTIITFKQFSKTINENLMFLSQEQTERNYKIIDSTVVDNDDFRIKMGDTMFLTEGKRELGFITVTNWPDYRVTMYRNDDNIKVLSFHVDAKNRSIAPGVLGGSPDSRGYYTNNLRAIESGSNINIKGHEGIVVYKMSQFDNLNSGNSEVYINNKNTVMIHYPLRTQGINFVVDIKFSTRGENTILEIQIFELSLYDNITTFSGTGIIALLQMQLGFGFGMNSKLQILQNEVVDDVFMMKIKYLEYTDVEDLLGTGLAFNYNERGMFVKLDDFEFASQNNKLYYKITEEDGRDDDDLPDISIFDISNDGYLYTSNSSGGAALVKWDTVMTEGLNYTYEEPGDKEYKFEIQASMASWGRRVYPFWFFDKKVDNDFKRVKDFPQNSELTPYLEKTVDNSSFMERMNRIPFGRNGYVEILSEGEELSYTEVPGLGTKMYSTETATYSKLPYDDYQKHFGYLLYGLLLSESIQYSDDKKMKQVLLSNFRDIYHDGQILYFLKLVVQFLDGYTLLEENGTIEQKECANTILNKDDLDIFQKISGVNQHSWSKNTKTMKDYLEEHYYMVSNDAILKLFESVSTFQEFETVFDEYAFHDLLLEDLAKDTIPKFIDVNKRILSRFEYYVQNQESLVKTIMKDIRYNQLFNQMVYSSYYPTSLGVYFINGLQSLITEVSSSSKTTALANQQQLETAITSVNNNIAYAQTQNNKSTLSQNEQNELVVLTNNTVYQANDIHSSLNNAEANICTACEYNTTYNDGNANLNDGDLQNAQTYVNNINTTTIEQMVCSANSTREKTINGI